MAGDSGRVTLGELEARLGHVFRDRQLLEEALTHSSARTRTSVTRDYERLEFLGDRVLGLVVAELLVERFPDDEEGGLARRLNRLVRGETCAEIGEQWDLGACLVLGGGEAESGGRRKKTIIADACEAVLGAIFLDGGFETARRVVRDFWGPLANRAEDVGTDPKSALQEWAQGHSLGLPRYVEVVRSGPDHAPRFTTEVRIKGFGAERGEGTSKRAAEQSAAEAFLEREGLWPAKEAR